ncbi:diuretic hormone class 2-like protein [Dinothrombium tinctorium]|uniref:Diuretic hormone class 2-like protein n=1 Tax=Dinothrombium tinctorium TaxID=1965070 RepID=A0A3S3PDT7_9ACAR|nr:diuretic hormone class 2-like protein [Dinothrombium tinctorium]RWS17409.1 diuretic hormone class 2-like protein [Dinothrombium tinctorium]RWS17429.1 diuretic hormone class 2-like protein [Dinothrombium tinctorium]
MKVSATSFFAVDSSKVYILLLLGICLIQLTLAAPIEDYDSNSSDKRGLDLGLSRGFSGRQAAKHLVGLASANFAGGPGRKR